MRLLFEGGDYNSRVVSIQRNTVIKKPEAGKTWE